MTIFERCPLDPDNAPAYVVESCPPTLDPESGGIAAGLYARDSYFCEFCLFTGRAASVITDPPF